MSAYDLGGFINVDLDLESPRPLGALIATLDVDGKLTMISSRQERGRHYASFETYKTKKTAETTVRELARVVSALPRNAAAEWKRCKRTLDVGIQARGKSAAVVRVSPAMMKAAHSIGADIVVTVYPERK
ncbi:MAG TPA: hypothetical protein VF407_10840 [Polyangiaceae bacterium]